MLQRTAPDVRPSTLVYAPDTPILSGTADLEVPARDAWRVVGDFAGFARFITGLDHTDMIGEGVRALRVKRFVDGNFVVEQLNTHDDAAMVMTWSLIHTSFDIGNLWALMRVEPRGEQACTVTWDIAGEPSHGGAARQPEFNAFVTGFLEMAMTNLRTLFKAQ
ncbi:SRPBCC family protein [Burkholderia perseverans]|uniref:SRPBCC family protein n=1 Tax=Burkholderia perseverans TaxID=2615214 RepID=UPI001FEF69B9|nr:SRPBCC family protein [Burkholderia perseverans]